MRRSQVGKLKRIWCDTSGRGQKKKKKSNNFYSSRSRSRSIYLMKNGFHEFDEQRRIRTRGICDIVPGTTQQTHRQRVRQKYCFVRFQLESQLS